MESMGISNLNFLLFYPVKKSIVYKMWSLKPLRSSVLTFQNSTTILPTEVTAGSCIVISIPPIRSNNIHTLINTPHTHINQKNKNKTNS